MTKATPHRRVTNLPPSSSVGQIRAAAIELFAQRGFAATSMRDIAKASGLSLAGLYHHFSGKDELLYRIEEDAYERLIAPLRQLPPDMAPAEKVERIICNHVVFFAGQITEMRVLSHELTALAGERGRRIERTRREYFSMCLEAVTRLLRGRGRRTPNPRAATMCLFGMINWIYTWYKPERDGNPEALARLMTQILMSGLVPAADKERRVRTNRNTRSLTSKTR